MKKTVVLGASTNSYKYAYQAVTRLLQNGHDTVPIGINPGIIHGVEILDLKQKPTVPDIDTITLYLSPPHQDEWSDYILSLKPKRIIFNPGAENSLLKQKSKAENIETVEACTLVMLSVGNY